MTELNSTSNPFVQLLNGTLPPRPPLFCPGPPTPAFVAKYRKETNFKADPVFVGEDDFLVPKMLGFDAITLWEFRSPKKTLIPQDNGVFIDVWGRKKQGSWYLNEGVLTSENAWHQWASDGFFTFPESREFQDISSRLRTLIRGSLAGLSFNASIAGAFEKMWQGMGFSPFAKALKKHDPVIGVALDYLLQFSLGVAERWIDHAGIKTFFVTDDMAYKGRPLIPPQEWERWVLPRYQQFNEKLHARGCQVILHSDGQVEPLIPLFIQAGFDALQALEPAAGVDIFRVMKRYKGKIVLIGNLDVSDLLVYGTPAEVAGQTQKILSCAQEEGARIAISPSQQLEEHIKVENVMAMCQSVLKFTSKR